MQFADVESNRHTSPDRIFHDNRDKRTLCGLYLYSIAIVASRRMRYHALFISSERITYLPTCIYLLGFIMSPFNVEGSDFWSLVRRYVVCVLMALFGMDLVPKYYGAHSTKNDKLKVKEINTFVHK